MPSGERMLHASGLASLSLRIISGAITLEELCGVNPSDYPDILQRTQVS